MQPLTCILSAFALSAAMDLGSAAMAVEMPKSGTDNFTNTWVTNQVTSLTAGGRTLFTYESEGVSRNDAGGPMFNFFSAHLVGSGEVIGGETHYNTLVIFTDPDGDQISEAGTSTTGTRGTTTIVGGTGKFTGISGSGEWTLYGSGPLKADDKVIRSVVFVKESWKLP